MPWLFPAMLAVTALDVLMSGRDLNDAFASLERSAQLAVPLIERGALQVWAQRLVSLLLLAATLHRIAGHVLFGRPAPAPLLSAAFLLYWTTTIAFPGLFGAHPRVSHEYLYPLLLGLACTMVEPHECERILELVRNGLFVFMLAGLPVLFVQPALVLEWTYTQGMLPGLPRYGGLASSPVLMGMLAQTALLVLWAEPYQRRWLHRAAWGLGLAILFVAQCKAAWLSFVIGGACMWMVQGVSGGPYGLAHPRRSATAVAVCLCVIFAALGLLVGTLVLDIPGRLDDFFNTPEGAQLASLTGRDRIWAVALAEWQDHPVFGYGLPMWDSEYRQEVGLPQATHAHNQFIDTLGRSGVVGFAGLVVYAAVLLALSLRHARAGRGLGLAMSTTLALLCVSEVPLLLIDYGSHLLNHYLLLVTLAAAAAGQAVAADPVVRPRTALMVAPVRRALAWTSLPLPVLRLPMAVLPATRTVVLSAVPFLAVVGSPLSDAVPRAGDRLLPAAALMQPAAAAHGPLQLTATPQLGVASASDSAASIAPAVEPLHTLAFERALHVRGAISVR